MFVPGEMKDSTLSVRQHDQDEGAIESNRRHCKKREVEVTSRVTWILRTARENGEEGASEGGRLRQIPRRPPG